MKRNIASRAFFGFCCGVTVGVMVCILLSALLGDGEYVSGIPLLTRALGNEWRSVLVSMLWCGLIGIAFAETALVLEIAHWGTLKQYTVHFLITGTVYIPFLLVTNWFGSWYTLLGIVGNIILTYGIAWGIQRALSLREVSAINAELERRQNERN